MGFGGFSKVDGWQRRAGKSTKDRWQARGQHTSVKSIRIGEKKNLEKDICSLVRVTADIQKVVGEHMYRVLDELPILCGTPLESHVY